jgi:hypothetical protein
MEDDVLIRSRLARNGLMGDRKASLLVFSRVRDRHRMAETPCRGEASGAAGQSREVAPKPKGEGGRLEPDRRHGGHA